MNICRPKYNVAIAKASTMNIDDLEGVVEFEERTNALPPTTKADLPLTDGRNQSQQGPAATLLRGFAGTS
ncbi:MAG: hypothetical protein WB781_05425 [Candidatus Sulfotelmatobacter sp.]